MKNLKASTQNLEAAIKQDGYNDSSSTMSDGKFQRIEESPKTDKKPSRLHRPFNRPTHQLAQLFPISVPKVWIAQLLHALGRYNTQTQGSVWDDPQQYPGSRHSACERHRDYSAKFLNLWLSASSQTHISHSPLTEVCKPEEPRRSWR